MKVIQPTQSLLVTYEVESHTSEGRVVRSESRAVPRLGEVVGWRVGEFSTPGNSQRVVRGVKISFDRSQIQDPSVLAPLRCEEVVEVPFAASNIQLRFTELN